ncbi:MAG: amino acid racemase [Nanoarchaeota archaeon]|nr:amino acid racemase [Nanoarchaeota archaeon]
MIMPNDYFGANLKVGVLGGIGPEATGVYYNKLIARLQQTGLIRDNSDYPNIIIRSIPAPELVGAISDEQLLPYRVGLKQLDNDDVDAIVMVCNTLHLYLPELQESVTAPIMDLRQKVRERLVGDGVRKVTVLGTPSTIRQGLYEFDDFEYVRISNLEIDALSHSIVDYNNGTDKRGQEQLVEDTARKSLDSGSDVVVLGCTEFAVMLKDVDIPKVDTLDVLVDATIDLYKKFRQDKINR